MANTKTHGAVNSALASLAASGPVLNVQSVTPIGSKFARVLGTISATASADQIKAAVKKLSGKLTPVEGSFAALASNGVSLSIEGIVGVVEERIVLDQTNEANFQAVASTNMYMDSEERLWSANKTDAGTVLIKSHANDDIEIMNQLMACVASSQVGVQEAEPVSKALRNERAAIVGGDLINFVSESSGRVSMGFVVTDVQNEHGVDKGLYVVDTNGTHGQINREMVTAAIASSEIEYNESESLMAVASGNISLEMMVEYYRKMFIRSPEYFEKFRQRLLSRALV
ncbi:hypothetical protein D3C85_475810 [compost metagenome]